MHQIQRKFMVGQKKRQGRRGSEKTKGEGRKEKSEWRGEVELLEKDRGGKRSEKARRNGARNGTKQKEPVTHTEKHALLCCEKCSQTPFLTSKKPQGLVKVR